MRKLVYLLFVLGILSMFTTVGNVIVSSAVQAANQQGGGAFSKPRKSTKKRVSKRKKSRNRTKKKRVTRAPAHNYDGTYMVQMQLTSNTTTLPCRGGGRKFQIRNNSTTLKTWALGDTIGGKISGGKMVLFGLKSGIMSTIIPTNKSFHWNGSTTIPRSRGQSGSGSLSGGYGNGQKCVWRISVRMQ